MGLSSEELDKHCQQILSDRRIKNRIVVLCEGEIKDPQGRRSPLAYRRMEQMPDANFYRRCVPESWKQYPPIFFNCGDRLDVINTYFNLLKLNQAKPDNSYLDQDKLFALVDLDIQSQQINNYPFADTESIYYHLYCKYRVIPKQIAEHRILTTGLIHKEAYFILPELQEVFDSSLLSPQYQSNSVSLPDIYLKIANETCHDIDLQKNFDRAIKRINHCQNIDCCAVEKFKHSWNHEFINSSDKQRQKELILTLLTIRKAKKYWEEIKPDSNCNINIERFREQLTLEIGKAYSRQDWNNPENHIASWFKFLYEIA